MVRNQELFKEAILDAKALRETAMAAARTSLAEHFEPVVKSMFKETVESIEEEEQVEEGAEIEETKHADMEEGKEADMEESADLDEATLDEILAELDSISEEADIEEGHVKGDGYDGKASKGNTGYDEKAKATHGDKKLHEAEEEEAEEEEEEIEGGEEAPKGDAESVEGTDEQEVVDITVGDLKDIIRSVFIQLQGGEDMQAMDAGTDLAADLGTDSEGEEEEDEISLSEILAELEAEEGKVEEGAGSSEIPGGKISPAAEDVNKTQFDEVKKELNEAVKVIKVLKKELNENNLFNAKLLYVNKIFRAKNLNEAQKTKVINAFDRATSVKEVENTYKTLLESLSTSTKKTGLKESVGLASRPIGNAPARPIVEADAFVSRWQTLAGIK